jgi:hypothetical protein
MKTFVQSPLNSAFGLAPTIPTIRSTPTASWPSVDLDVKPVVRRPGLAVAPILNKVYFTKKTLKETVERYNPNTLQHETAQVWEIPFSVDVNEPVTELTQKIQAVMTAKKIYKHWDINFNTFLITASEVTSEWDTLP